MERDYWLKLRDLIAEACSRISHPGVRFSDRWILLTYCWAVLHDRPTYWACRLENWPPEFRPMALPSQPTMSRRLRSPRIQWALALILEQIRGDRPPDPGGPITPGAPGEAKVVAIDGKPLPVGGFSKDRGAGVGYGAGLKFKGYKLFALWDDGPVPLAWEVRSAGRSESTEADRLLAHLAGRGYVVGDAIYDCNRLYEEAAAQDHQLLAPKKRAGAGLGHGPQSSERLLGLDLLGQPVGRRIYAHRTEIERKFGSLASFGGGLAGLPSWVRTPGRVGMWVEVKLIINAIRILMKQRVAA